MLAVTGRAVRLVGDAGERRLLARTKVFPTRLEAGGFEWQHRRVEQAIDAALS